MLYALQEFQKWYLSNCNDDWERQHGIKIDTLANPGWTIIIELYDTPLEDKKFKNIQIERTENNWTHCKIEEKSFKGAGGPQNLEEMIQIFLDWAKKHQKFTNAEEIYRQNLKDRL